MIIDPNNCYESLSSDLDDSTVNTLRKNASKMVNRLLCDNEKSIEPHCFLPHLFNSQNLRELAQEKPFQLYHDRRPF